MATIYRTVLVQGISRLWADWEISGPASGPRVEFSVAPSFTGATEPLREGDTITFTAVATYYPTVSFTGQSGFSATVSGPVTVRRAVSVSAVSSFSTDFARIRNRAAAFTGVSGLAAIPTVFLGPTTRRRSVLLSGVSAMSVDYSSTYARSVNLVGKSGIVAYSNYDARLRRAFAVDSDNTGKLMRADNDGGLVRL